MSDGEKLVLGVLGFAAAVGLAAAVSSRPRPRRRSRPPLPRFGTHDDAVEWLAVRAAQRDCFVAADLPGWPKPRQVGGHVPDLDITCGSREELIEVETMDSVFSSHSRSQDRTFRRWEARRPRRRYQQVIV